MKYPQKFKDLIESLETLPGVGPKTAERFAFHIIDKKNNDSSNQISSCILDAIQSIKECEKCGMISDNDICEICEDETRDNRLMIVQSAKDVIAFEKTKVFNGRYFVLNGVISPTNGVGPEGLNLNKLIYKLETENISEVIISTSSNIDGELTALYLKKLIDKYNIKTYRIGYGLPVSADIEYVDEITLIKSLEGKREM